MELRKGLLESLSLSLHLPLVSATCTHVEITLTVKPELPSKHVGALCYFVPLMTSNNAPYFIYTMQIE